MEKHTHSLWTKGVGAVVALSLVLSVNFATPRKAEAFVDPLNLIQNTISAVISANLNVKEYILDTLAWQVANLAIKSMTKSIVNWINSGFNGSPAFVTDLNQNLRGVGDAVAARFFDELSMQSIAKTPHQDKVLDAVRLAYYLRTSPESFYTKNPYTLNQVSSDDKAFLAGDFSKGGWDAWFATVMNPQNNPYGAQMLANEALENAVSNATGVRLQEVSWNRGFLSWRGECTAQKPLSTPEEAAADASSVPLGGEDTCASYEIKTPGSVIMEQLNTQLGSNVNRLVSADELNEIVGALMNQLVSKVLGDGGSGGLAGASKPSAGGGSSYLDQATNEAEGTEASVKETMGTTFASTIASQQQYVSDYEASWQKIRGAAASCPAGSPGVQQLLTRAENALAKAADASAALGSIQARVVAAQSGGDQSAGLFQVADEFNKLTASGTLPSGGEIAEATAGAAEGDGTGDPSLYEQAKSCSIGS